MSYKAEETKIEVTRGQTFSDGSYIVSVKVDDFTEMGQMHLTPKAWRQVLLTVSAQLERFEKEEADVYSGQLDLNISATA